MKNLTLILISLLCFQYQVNAQLSGIGIGAGGNVSSFEYGDQTNQITSFDNKDKLGGTAGIRFDFDLGSQAAKFSPEIFLIQNGSREFFSSLNIQDLVERKVSLDYIGLYLPLTLYVELDQSGGTYRGGYGYPQNAANFDSFNGILISARGFFDYVLNGQVIDDFNKNSEIQFNKAIDKLDYGYSFSAGFVLQGAYLLFGYDKGIKNIVFEDALGSSQDQNYLLQNKGFHLKVGYLGKLN